MAKTGNFGGSRHGIFPVGAGAAAASSISQDFDGDRAAASTTAQYAVLILAHAGHGVGEPVTGANQQDDEQKRGEIYDHPVAVVVWGGVLFVFCQALCGLRRPQPRSRDSLAKSQDARAAPGWGRFVAFHAGLAYHGRRRYSTDPFGSTRVTGALRSHSQTVILATLAGTVPHLRCGTAATIFRERRRNSVYRTLACRSFLFRTPV